MPAALANNESSSQSQELDLLLRDENLQDLRNIINADQNQIIEVNANDHEDDNCDISDSDMQEFSNH